MILPMSDGMKKGLLFLKKHFLWFAAGAAVAIAVTVSAVTIPILGRHASMSRSHAFSSAHSVSVRSLQSSESTPVSSSSVVSSTSSVIAVSSVDFTQRSATLKPSETLQLTAKITPTTAADQALTWTTTDRAVATVNQSGLVTAVGEGTAKIRATCSDGQRDTCTVEVASSSAAAPAVSASSSNPSFYGSEFADSSQVVSVVASSMHTQTAAVSWYQKSGGSWSLVSSSVSALIGQNGMVDASQRVQDTNTTPAGVFAIPFAFGSAPNPGTKLDYRVSDSNSYWNENSGSAAYNRWVEGNPGGEYEQLQTQPLYKYAIVLDYNWSQTPGKGAGIFIHIKPSHYTGGCVGIGEESLVSLLQWLDPSQNPRVVICSQSGFSNYYH